MKIFLSYAEVIHSDIHNFQLLQGSYMLNQIRRCKLMAEHFGVTGHLVQLKSDGTQYKMYCSLHAILKHQYMSPTQAFRLNENDMKCASSKWLSHTTQSDVSITRG